MSADMNDASDARVGEQELLERRAAVLARRPRRTDTAETVDMAVFRLARERYAIELTYLLQIFPLRDLATLPGARAPLVGLTPWRGALLRVIDLAAALGRPQVGIADRGRVLAVGEGERAGFGILIDAVEDVLAVPESAIRPLAGADAGESGLLRGVTTDAVLVLDGQELLRNFS